MRIVLAFTGDRRTIEAARRLRASGADVLTLSLVTGYGPSLDGVREQALAAGARRAHVVEVREEFARTVLVPALRSADPVLDVAAAGAVVPVLARWLVEIARLERADGVAHASPGDAVARGVRAIDPGLRVIAVADTAGDPGAGPPARPRAARPDRAALLTLAFEDGEPVSVNGVALPPADLFDLVAVIAADHGVGTFVPRLAYRALCAAGVETGVVQVRLADGRADVPPTGPSRDGAYRSLEGEHVAASLVGAL